MRPLVFGGINYCLAIASMNLGLASFTWRPAPSKVVRERSGNHFGIAGCLHFDCMEANDTIFNNKALLPNLLWDCRVFQASGWAKAFGPFCGIAIMGLVRDQRAGLFWFLFISAFLGFSVLFLPLLSCKRTSNPPFIYILPLSNITSFSVKQKNMKCTYNMNHICEKWGHDS